MSDYIHKTSWWRKNRTWILVMCVLILSFIIAIGTILGKPIGDFTKVMVDPSVYNNAFDIVQEDERVIALLGEMQPIHFFELMEGEVQYADNNTQVMMTVGIKGSKQKGKMDIVANKKDTIWHYKIIRIRTKKPKKVIVVLDKTEQ